MPEVIIEPEAEREIADAMDWYEARDTGLGAALLSEVDSVLSRLESGVLRGIGGPGGGAHDSGFGTDGVGSSPSRCSSSTDGRSFATTPMTPTRASSSTASMPFCRSHERTSAPAR